MMVTSSMVSKGAEIGQYVYETHPKRAKYLAATFEDRGMPIPLIGQTGLVKSVGSKMAGYLSNVDIHEFYKIPALGGLTVAELPITALMAYFYIALIPGRVDSAVKRAPTMDSGKKDYREVGDVMTRDMLSIATFLFGLNILNAGMLKTVQQQGHLVPFGMAKPNEAKLQILGGQPEFWSRWPQLPLDEKVKKLRGEEQHAISHPDLKNQYHLANEGTLAHIVSNPINRKGLVPLFDSERKGLEHFKGNGPLSGALEAMSAGFKQVVESANKLDATLEDALHLTPQPTKGTEATATTDAYWKAVDPVREQVFGLPMLNSHSEVEALTLPQVRNAMADRVEHAKTALDITLAKLDPRGNQALTQLIDQVKSGHGTGLTDQLHDWALNNGERINTHLTQHLGLKKGSKDFQQSFDQYWNTLHKLETQAPVYHARHHALEALASDEHGPKVLGGLKALFNHSSQAMASLNQLEAVAVQEKVTRQSFNPFKKPEWKPREFLGDAAVKMRTPADWLALVFILAALGYFPVWFNETLTNYRFKHDQRPEPSPASTPLMAANGPNGGGHKANESSMLHHLPALTVAAAPPLAPTPISATNKGSLSSSGISLQFLPASAHTVEAPANFNQSSQASLPTWATTPTASVLSTSSPQASLSNGSKTMASSALQPSLLSSPSMAIPYPTGKPTVLAPNPFQL